MIYKDPDVILPETFDFLTHAYPLVRSLIREEGLSLASLEDIGAMKLNAIAHSGNRQKDFYDLFFLLEHHSCLEGRVVQG